MTYFNSILCLLLGTLLQANIVWSSEVYVQNNSDEKFTFHCASNELSREYWTCDSGTILPGRRKRVSRFNRDTGITINKTFNFRQYLKLDGQDVVFLAQRLIGTRFNSDISQSIQGDTNFYGDRVLRTSGPLFGDFYVKYRAYFTGGSDDIEYIITKRKQIDLPSTKNDPDSINIVTYNTWFLPPLQYTLCPRAHFIPYHLEQYDVIIFNEVTANSCRDILLRRLTPLGFEHNTKILNEPPPKSIANGGVMIVSKFKITKEDQHIYRGACTGDDCAMAKGVNYARINKDGKNYHIFGTHAQADSPLGGLIYDKDQSGNRAKQFQQMEDFITSLDIPKNEPVILGGDFNVERKENTGEYITMLSTLKASEPRHVRKNSIVSHYPDGNDFCPNGISDDLDYIFVSEKYQPSSGGFTQVHFVKNHSAFKPIPTDKDKWDLSDHFPVAAHLKFNKLSSQNGEDEL